MTADNDVIKNLTAVRDSYEIGTPGWFSADMQIHAYRRQSLQLSRAATERRDALAMAALPIASERYEKITLGESDEIMGGQQVNYNDRKGVRTERNTIIATLAYEMADAMIAASEK